MSSRPWWVCTTFSFRKRAPTKICDVFRISSVSIIHQPGTSPSRNAQFIGSNQSRQLRRNAIRRRIFRLHTNRLQETPKKPDPQCQPQPKCARIVLKPTCTVLPVWDQVSIMDDLRWNCINHTTRRRPQVGAFFWAGRKQLKQTGF